MQIRKISIGPDYKSGGMHYLVGQSVLNGRHIIHLIKYSVEEDAYQIDIEDTDAHCLLYTSPSPRDRTTSRIPSAA